MNNKEVDHYEKLALVAGPYITSLRVPPELLHLVRSTLHDLLVDADLTTPYSASVEIEPEGTYRILADGRTYRSGLEAMRVPDGLVRMLLLAELDALVVPPDRVIQGVLRAAEGQLMARVGVGVRLGQGQG